MRFCVHWKTYNVVSYLHSPNQPTKKWKSHHPTTNCSFIKIPWNIRERPILSRLMWKSFFMATKSWHRSRTEILKPLSSHWNIGRPQDLLLSLATFSSWFQLIPVCFTSTSVDRLQVVFGLPWFLLPWGVHWRACLVTLATAFSVCGLAIASTISFSGLAGGEVVVLPSSTDLHS